MKKSLFLLVVTFLTVSCSPKLGQQYYNNPAEILFQQSVNYMPKGYDEKLCAYYPGVLAIVKDQLLFDTQGAGSRPEMTYLNDIKIGRKEISEVLISNEKALNRKVISIKTEYRLYSFYMENADSIYKLISDWQKGRR